MLPYPVCHLTLFLFLIISSLCSSASASDSSLFQLFRQQPQPEKSILRERKSVQKFPEVSVRPGSVIFASSKPQHGSSLPATGRVNKRSSPRMPSSAINVCQSVSDWFSKAEGVDTNGNKVQILQRIAVNGTMVNQFFFETVCVNSLIYEDDDIFGTTFRRTEELQESECKGVDKLKWNSVCREDWIWTQAKVVTADGETGWSWIMVRGSCSCAIWSRPQPSGPSIGRRNRMTLKSNRRKGYGSQRGDSFV